MLKAILFDLDGTLRHNLPSGSVFFADHAAELGLRITADDRLRAMRWEHFYWANSAELKADRLAHPDERDFWNLYAVRALTALGAWNGQAEAMAPQVSAYMAETYKPESVVPEDALRVLPALQQGGYVLGLVSNREKSYAEVIESLGLAPYFQLVLAGGEVQMWKPEPHIFVHACARLKLDPVEAAYVGDNYFADVVGARRAGLRPVLYDPRGIFMDPGCPTIASFDELPAVIGSS
ncbi:MAG TPA: HAD family hydrolase [Anaerolineales bacterium]|nr:HAD family hydrolase [Anaerolineales bacterium]